MAGPVDWDALVHDQIASVFGEAFTYTPAGGQRILLAASGLALSGVYDEAYRPLTPLGGANGLEPFPRGMQGDTNTAAPVLGVQLSQFPPALAARIAAGTVQGDTITLLRTGESFLISEAEPDGHGWAKLRLTTGA